MRVLVTGGTGFLGSYIVAELRRRSHFVRMTVRPSRIDSVRSLQNDPGVEITPWDLREAAAPNDALAGIDAVIHCAAAMSGDLEAQRAITVEGTRHLLAAMELAQVRRLVALGTFAIYDYRALSAGALLDEMTPLESQFELRGPYIRAKREQEELIRAHTIAAGWRWTLLRPGIVFGPGRTWFHQLGIRASRRWWVSLGGASILPLSFVAHCAEAVVATLESDAVDGLTFNIVDDDLPTRGEYLRALADATQPRPSITDISWRRLEQAAQGAAWLSNAMGRGWLPLPDLLQPASIAARSKPLCYTNARAKQSLRWAPRSSFHEAFAQSTGAD